MQAACRVEKDDIVAVLLRMLYGCLGYIHGVCLPHLEHRNVKLRADRLQLLYCGGTVNVAGGEQRALALLLHVARELCAVCGFACALQADEHHDARQLRRDVELLVLSAHQLAQLLVDNLDNHLRRGKRFEHVRARGLLRDVLYKVLDDLVADVRLQQRHAHLAHRVLHIGGGQAAFAAQLFESRIQFFG